MVVEIDIAIGIILRMEAARYRTKLLKTKLLIQMDRRRICDNHRIELQNPEAKPLPLLQAVLYQRFANMIAALICSDRIARVGNMAAAPDVIKNGRENPCASAMG